MGSVAFDNFKIVPPGSGIVHLVNLEYQAIVQNLKSAIDNGETEAGLNMNDVTVDNIKTIGVTECLRVKEQALISTMEAAEMRNKYEEQVKIDKAKVKQKRRTDLLYY